MKNVESQLPIEINEVDQEDLLQLYHDWFGHHNKRYVLKHISVWGPFQSSESGFCYFVLFIKIILDSVLSTSLKKG